MAHDGDKREDIGAKLRVADVFFRQGVARVDGAREVHIASQTHDDWRRQDGWMGTGQLKQPRCPQKENARLTRVVSDPMHAKLIRAEAARGRVSTPPVAWPASPHATAPAAGGV